MLSLALGARWPAKDADQTGVRPPPCPFQGHSRSRAGPHLSSLPPQTGPGSQYHPATATNETKWSRRRARTRTQFDPGLIAVPWSTPTRPGPSPNTTSQRPSQSQKDPSERERAKLACSGPSQGYPWARLRRIAACTSPASDLMQSLSSPANQRWSTQFAGTPLVPRACLRTMICRAARPRQPVVERGNEVGSQRQGRTSTDLVPCPSRDPAPGSRDCGSASWRLHSPHEKGCTGNPRRSLLNAPTTAAQAATTGLRPTSGAVQRAPI